MPREIFTQLVRKELQACVVSYWRPAVATAMKQTTWHSIYTPYRWVHTGRHKYNNYTPQWFAEYHGCIIYVYPGADSLVLT